MITVPAGGAESLMKSYETGDGGRVRRREGIARTNTTGNTYLLGSDPNGTNLSHSPNCSVNFVVNYTETNYPVNFVVN
jgi:hypothetical protein